MAPLNFSPQREDVTYRGFFQTPQFPFMRSIGDSFGALHTALSKHGVRLADLTVEGNVANPAQIVLVCRIPVLNATLRLRLENMEFVATNVSPALLSLIPLILQDVVKAVGQITKGDASPISSHTVIWEAHGSLFGQLVADYTKSLVQRQPWDKAANASVGVAFQLGPDPSQQITGASIVVGPSGILPSALYLQVNLMLEGGVAFSELQARMSAIGTPALERIGLLIQRDTA